MAPPTRRRLILDAAATVIRRDGPGAFTLDAVAAEAAVSKGGLLYHFPSKDDLAGALVGQLVDRFDERLAGADGGDTFTDVYAQAMLHSDLQQDHVIAGLLLALTMPSSLLEPFRERYRRWAERLEADTGDPIRAAILRLALDGLWFADLLDLQPPDPAVREQIVARLRGAAAPR